MPDVTEKRVWEHVKARFCKRNKVEADSAKRVKVVVTRGRIEITSPDSKFSPIHVKTSDIEKRPKMPMGSSTWCTLDFIQNVEAKYKYINFQVDSRSDMEGFISVLCFAWDAIDTSGFFPKADEIQPIAPVHRPAPNASSTRLVPAPLSRHDRIQVRVDQDDGVHPSFKSDFKDQKKHQKTTDVMKGMFDDYGITGEKKEEQAVPVHTLPSNAQQKKKSLLTSYASVAGKPTKNEYSSVDSVPHQTIEKPKQSVDGLNGITFYGKSKPNNDNYGRKTPTSANRVSTKDSMDSAPRPSSLRILSTLPEEPSRNARKAEFIDDDLNGNSENVLPSQTFPTHQKSLTSSNAVSTFDATTRRNNPTVTKKTFGVSTNENSHFILPTDREESAKPSSREDSAKPSYRGTSSYNSYNAIRVSYPSCKGLYNIGNSCYMNSTLQILSACPIFVSELMRAHGSLENKGNMKYFFEVTTRLAGVSFPNVRIHRELLEKMREMLKRLDAIFEESGGRAQQDAEECLTALLGMVSDLCTGNGFKRRDSGVNRSLPHSSPCKSPIKKIKEETDDSSSVKKEEGEEGEEQQKKKMPADCDPVDLMEVKMRDVKKCSTCDNKIEKDAVEHRVHLGIGEPQKKGVPWTPKYVQQLLAAEVAQEEIIGDFKCERCNQTGEAIGTKHFVQFGEYIIIVLKRFGFDNGQYLRKLKSPIRVPMYLDMDHFMEREDLGVKKEEIKADDTIELDQAESVPAGITEILMEGEDIPMKETDILSTGTETWAEDKKVNKSMQKLNVSGEEEEEEEEIDKTQEDVEMTDVEADVSTAHSSDVITVKARPSPSPVNGRMMAEDGLRSGATTPIERRSLNLSTPKKKDQRELEIIETPSSRKDKPKKRMRTSTERGETRVSSDPRTSLTRSEPSKKVRHTEKEKKKSISESPPPSVFSPSHIDDNDDDVTVVDELSAPVNPHNTAVTPSEKKPCWHSVDAEKEKRRSIPKRESDAFEFVDDIDEEEEGGGGMRENGGRKMTGQRKQANPKKWQAPLKSKNGANKDEYGEKIREQRKEKNENVRPLSRTRGNSEMDQRGGGRKMDDEEERDENGEREDGKKEDKEEEKMESDDGGARQVSVTPHKSHVSRRSRARNNRMRVRGMDDIDMVPSGEEEEQEEEGKKEEYGSQEGGFEKQTESTGHEEDEDTTDEVVHGTPPEEMEEEEKKGEEDEGMEEGEEEGKDDGNEGEENADSLDKTIEEEEENRKRDKEKKEKRSCISSETGVYEDTVKDDAIIDRGEPDRLDELFDADEILSSEQLDGDVMMEGCDANREFITPAVSPISSGNVIRELEGKSMEVKEEVVEIKKEEMEIDEREMTEEEKKTEIRKKGDETRAAWREIFIDTDPSPPSDHFVFRPVDENWMKSQCELFSFPYATDDDCVTADRVCLRAQSSICKISTAPGHGDTVECDGDGNCLFRALSWWLTGKEGSHAKLRKRIVRFMFKFPVEFGARMSGDEGGQMYTEKDNNRMLEEGEWGTHCEIYGAATLFGVDIHTFHDGKWKSYRPLFQWTSAGGFKVSHKISLNERTRFGIYLTNNYNYHYDVVKYMEPVGPPSSACYRLIATLLHRGATAHSGHYVADVYDQKKEVWLHCDDSDIKRRCVIEVLQSAMNDGYVLVYAKNETVIKESIA